MLSDSRLEAVLYSPPDADEIEVSIFGPGLGECILVHLGSAEWMVVDSCVRWGTKIPVAVEYLEQLGLEVAKSVSMVIATHWHDDHVRGISTLLEHAANARFYSAGVFSAAEFEAIGNVQFPSSKFTSGIEELAKVRAVVESRRGSGGQPIGLLSAAKRIFKRTGSIVSEAWALSPSDEDANRGIQHIASLVGATPSVAMRVPSLDPNDLSLVLHLKTVAGPVLLGGDLEHATTDRSRGWHAILDNQGLPSSPATLFKIPHHGSKNADCPEVWEHLVEDDPVCLISPYGRGSTPVPRDSDLERIRNRTPTAFITSMHNEPSRPRGRTAQKMIREATRSFTQQNIQLGQIQARSKGAGWVVRGTGPSRLLS